MELIDIQTALQITNLGEEQLHRWIEENKISTHKTSINDQPQTLIFKYSLIQHYQKDLLNRLLRCEELLSGEDTTHQKQAFINKHTQKRKKRFSAARFYQDDYSGIMGFLFFIAFIFVLFQVWANSWLF